MAREGYAIVARALEALLAAGVRSGADGCATLDVLDRHARAVADAEAVSAACCAGAYEPGATFLTDGALLVVDEDGDDPPQPPPPPPPRRRLTRTTSVVTLGLPVSDFIAETRAAAAALADAPRPDLPLLPAEVERVLGATEQALDDWALHLAQLLQTRAGRRHARAAAADAGWAHMAAAAHSSPAVHLHKAFMAARVPRAASLSLASASGREHAWGGALPPIAADDGAQEADGRTRQVRALPSCADGDEDDATAADGASAPQPRQLPLVAAARRHAHPPGAAPAPAATPLSAALLARHGITVAADLQADVLDVFKAFLAGSTG